MNEFNREGVRQIVNQAWKLFDILRTAIPSEDLGISLFLLSAYKDGFIEDNSHHYFGLKRGDFLNNIKTDNRYKDIVPIYARAIENLPEDKTSDLIYCLNSLNGSILQNNFREIFDELLYRLSEIQGRFSGEFIQPIEISRFIMKLANLPRNATIYNPFAGLASFGIFLEGNQQYYGQEIVQRTWALGKLRLMAYKSHNANFLQEDSINYWPEHQKFDLIVSHPPFGFRLENNSTNRNSFFGSTTIENFLIENGKNNLEIEGKLICLLPTGFLFRGGKDQKLREELIKNGLIDTVISLPTGLLRNTGISTCIVVIRKSLNPTNTIRFVDGDDFVISKGQREKKLDEDRLINIIESNHESVWLKHISYNKIRENEYNLSVARYFGEDYVGLKLVPEIGEYIIGSRAEKGEPGKFVRIRDLKDNIIDGILDIKTIEDKEILLNSIKKIEESCLLMALRWKTLKPTYFIYDGTPIYISNDIAALKIDENKVNVNFLINELHSDYVKEQINRFRIKGAVPMIRKDDLSSVKIDLPNLEEQNKKYYAFANEYLKSVVKESNAIYEEKKINVEDENSFLRHQIAGSLKNVRGAFKFIHKILEEKVKPQLPELYDYKASEELETTLQTYLNIIDRDLISINKSVNRAGDRIELMDLNIENFDLLEFIKEYAESLNIRSNNFYSVILNLDENAITEYGMSAIHIEGDKELLRKMFDNIIENAEKHAFTYGINNKNQNKISFDLIYNFEDFEVQLDICNTGKPLPESMTHESLIRKGSSSGKNSGDGVGVWFVNEVMKLHKGHLGYTDETGPEGIDSEFVTTIELTFPIIPAI
jgi:type I restriction enzyme M protein